jgi:hypothetical protein
MKIRDIRAIVFFLLFMLILPSVIFFVSNILFSYNFIASNIINNELSILFKENTLLQMKKADFYYKL